jgi:hypothetical protein
MRSLQIGEDKLLKLFFKGKILSDNQNVAEYSKYLIN